jgi:hypothetical protein
MAAAGSLEVDRQVHALDDVATAWTAAGVSSGVRSVVRLR